MQPHIDSSIPVVGVCNIAETFYEFLSREHDDARRVEIVKGEQYRGDRALVWFGDPKLVIASFALPHAEYLYQLCGYEHTTYLHPENPTPFLCHDILKEPSLLRAIVDYAGAGQTIQLIPYATTPEFMQLVKVLRDDYALRIILPETPEAASVWVRDYADSKLGYRILAGHWWPNADELLPEGVTCHTPEMAADAAYWFSEHGRPCIVKADNGENGMGNLIVYPGTYANPAEVLSAIQHHDFVGNHSITVEMLIEMDTVVSPSVELYVPPVGKGDPYITYLSDQLFLEFGDFCGVLVSKELRQRPWYPPLAEAGLRFARGLQKMGYVGLFDIDAVVDRSERAYLLEVNPRRTGGTHVHEFAEFMFGPEYLDRVALLSYDAMKSGPIRTFDALLEAVGDLQYPVAGAEKGVIITITSALEAGEFGCIVVAEDGVEALRIQRQLADRIAQLA